MLHLFWGNISSKIVISKIFQINYQNWWLNNEDVSVEDSLIELLELAIRVVSSVTKLPTIIVGAVYLSDQIANTVWQKDVFSY